MRLYKLADIIVGLIGAGVAMFLFWLGGFDFDMLITCGMILLFFIVGVYLSVQTRITTSQIEKDK